MTIILRKSKSWFRLGKKLAVGKCLGGRGCLTIAKCNAIQNFYGRAISDSKNDPEAMSKATWAILKHYSSTEQHPLDDNCPVGTTSWSSYQRDKATGLKTYHQETKQSIYWKNASGANPNTISKLADKHFLESVKRCHAKSKWSIKSCYMEFNSWRTICFVTRNITSSELGCMSI